MFSSENLCYGHVVVSVISGAELRDRTRAGSLSWCQVTGLRWTTGDAMEEAGCRWERPRQCLAAGAAGKEVLREDKAEQGGAGMVVEWCANSGLQMGVGPPTGNGSASLCFLATSIKSHP